MKNPIEIIERIDQLFNALKPLQISDIGTGRVTLTPEQVKEEMLKLLYEVGADMLFTCWIFSHRTQVILSQTKDRHE